MDSDRIILEAWLVLEGGPPQLAGLQTKYLPGQSEITVPEVWLQSLERPLLLVHATEPLPAQQVVTHRYRFRRHRHDAARGRDYSVYTYGGMHVVELELRRPTNGEHQPAAGG